MVSDVAIIPVFVKMGETDSEFAKTLNMGDRIVIAGSDLSLGHHINSPYNKKRCYFIQHNFVG